MARIKQPAKRNWGTRRDSRASASTITARKSPGTEPESSGAGAGGKKKNQRRFNLGTQALREMRRLQKTVDVLIPAAPFIRTVREISNYLAPEITRWQAEALQALQEAAEDYIIQLFEDSMLCATHAKCVTLRHDQSTFKMSIYCPSGCEKTLPPKGEHAGIDGVENVDIEDDENDGVENVDIEDDGNDGVENVDIEDDGSDGVENVGIEDDGSDGVEKIDIEDDEKDEVNDENDDEDDDDPFFTSTITKTHTRVLRFPVEFARLAGIVAPVDVKPEKVKKASVKGKPRSPLLHPPYFEMIKEAIVTLKERTGSSQYAITKFIEEKQKNLPASFKKVLFIRLKRFVAAGKLVKVKASYKLPAASAPAKKPVTKPKTVAKPKTAKKKAPAKKAAVAKPKPAPKAKAAAKPKTVAKPKLAAKAKPKGGVVKKAAAKTGKK